MLDLIRRAPGELTLVALGPLTNLALAWRRDAHTFHQLAEVVIMGGAVTVPGNVTPVAEFNIHVDPEAAQIVFASGVPITLIGLDVTERVRLTGEMIDLSCTPRRIAPQPIRDGLHRPDDRSIAPEWSVRRAWPCTIRWRSGR